MTSNDMKTIATRLREYLKNRHHVNPMSERFKTLIIEAADAFSALAKAQPQGDPMAYRYKEGHAAWESEKPWEPTTLAHGAVLLERKALAANGTFRANELEYYSALTVEPLYAEQPALVSDLDDVDWKAIKKAADESAWMPPEYMRNEWVSDVCAFLRDPREEQAVPAEILASKLIDSWVVAHCRRVPWSKAIEITSVVTGMAPEEKSRLLALDDDQPVSSGLPDVDVLAQIIRKVDGSNSLGAGALAESILSEISHLNGVKP
jgi:hypothetical protein